MANTSGLRAAIVRSQQPRPRPLEASADRDDAFPAARECDGEAPAAVVAGAYRTDKGRTRMLRRYPRDRAEAPTGPPRSKSSASPPPVVHSGVEGLSDDPHDLLSEPRRLGRPKKPGAPGLHPATSSSRRGTASSPERGAPRKVPGRSFCKLTASMGLFTLPHGAARPQGRDLCMAPRETRQTLWSCRVSSYVLQLGPGAVRASSLPSE